MSTVLKVQPGHQDPKVLLADQLSAGPTLDHQAPRETVDQQAIQVKMECQATQEPRERLAMEDQGFPELREIRDLQVPLDMVLQVLKEMPVQLEVQVCDAK